MLFQSANRLAIVKPTSFGYDDISAETNVFQNNHSSNKLFKLVEKVMENIMEKVKTFEMND